MITSKFKSVAIAALGLTALGFAVPQARAEDATLAIPAQNLLFLSQYIAADQHLWEKQGLNTKVIYITGIGATNAVIAGSADFSMASGPTVTRANAKGQKLVALLTAIDKSGQSVVIRKEVADAAHFDPKAPLAERAKVLKGKKIAVSAIGAIPDAVLRIVAKDGGLGPNDMVVPPMQPPEFMAAMANKSIDGFSNSPPFPEQLIAAGTGVLVSDSRLGEPTEFDPVSSSLLLARGDFCAKQKSTCEKMVHALYQATQIIRNDPKTSLAVVKAHFGTAYDDKVLQAAYETVKAMTPDKPITTAQMLENGDNMNVAAGFMKAEDKLSDYKPLIDNSYVK
ncbi:MAG TPA: ABC transporter substrate-binding protein [Stellaceae bacterium]|nr:ABC transporter substrate-binding protein [Stellaceae bacterium]HXS42287.1 ABC transporter substrate-binding protein [Stellaceae bacterium]